MFLSDVRPYELTPAEKHAFLVPRLAELVEHHRARCAPYARWIADWRTSRPELSTVDDVPFLPVSVFKEYDLRSTTEEVMSVSSSSTTGTGASRIYVDKQTRKRQNLSASRLLSDFVGEAQRPYIVFDEEATVRGTAGMSARGAAIMSLAHLASEFHFVMRAEGDHLVLDPAALAHAIDRVSGRPFLAYGFTYLLYQAHQELDRAGFHVDAHQGTVFLHSGGWKRMADIAVDKDTFNHTIASRWTLTPSAVIDFYGMVEQVGVVYPDCPYGSKHVPYWADVVVRRPDSLEPAAPGEVGLLQLVNCLPLSAPNHSVLTEDLGELQFEDGCPCGRRGRAFRFVGRAPRAELRGCSDVARH
jgi:hypothetical protein